MQGAPLRTFHSRKTWGPFRGASCFPSVCRATDGPHHCSGHCSQEPAGVVNTAEVFCARKTSLGLEGLKTDNWYHYKLEMAHQHSRAHNLCVCSGLRKPSLPARAEHTRFRLSFGGTLGGWKSEPQGSPRKSFTCSLFFPEAWPPWSLLRMGQFSRVCMVRVWEIKCSIYISP